MKTSVNIALACFIAMAVLCSGQTTTLTAATSNNTSGSASFVPITDSRSGINTVNYEPSPANTSTIDIHNLVYPGFNGLVFAETMSWFQTNPPLTGYSCFLHNAGDNQWSVSREECGGHVLTGYESSNATQVHNQINDMIARGFNGMIVTWEGVYLYNTTDPTISDLALQAIVADAAARCTATCPFYVAILYDQSAFIYSEGYAGAPHTTTSSTITTSANENAFSAKLHDDICYMNKKYFGSPAYLKVGGKPVLQPFISEAGNTNGSAPSWADLWINMNNFTNALSTNCPIVSSLYNGAANNGRVAFYFGTGNTAFTHDGLTNSTSSGPVFGAYLWENFNIGGLGLGYAAQVTEATNALSSAASFYSTSKGYPPVETFGAAWPGFDDQLADWSPHDSTCTIVGAYCNTSGRIGDRSCGTNWLAALSKAGSYYSSVTQLPYISVVTWNDYDEGTEIETGIDNCWTLTTSITGSTVSWTLTSANAAASLSTIDHLTFYSSTDGVNLNTISDNVPATASGILSVTPLITHPGTYTLYVKAWGKNSIQNHFSTTGSYVLAAPPVVTPITGVPCIVCNQSIPCQSPLS